jgi:flagellar hook assembly protein FlgD
VAVYSVKDVGADSSPTVDYDEVEMSVLASTVAVEDSRLSEHSGLRAIVPNPFAVSASISYVLSTAGRVRLTVSDVQGRRVRVLDEGERSAGVHQVGWNGTDGQGVAQPAGIYWARLEVNGRLSMTKLVRVAH